MNHYRLNNGVEIPVLGFGTWKAANGEEAYQAVLAALRQWACARRPVYYHQTLEYSSHL